MKEKILQRFLKYVSIDTQSNENSETCPSTDKQLNLARHLAEELTQLGMSNVSLDENGYVMATLPGNSTKKVPVIGFIAHMDTAPDMPGNNVKPQIVDNYNGTEILLNKESGIKLSPEEFPDLLMYKGNTIICTDGTTLLGADDKAGIAEIITAMEYLIAHPEIKHGDLRIGFTPDEEIGRGVDFFDVKKFDAEFAYTMDGSMIGELEYENFNAAGAKVNIYGNNIHPGYAKGKMLNSALLAMELNAMLPQNEKPEYTEGYEGFYHLIRVEGTVEKSFIQYIIRDHDRAIFEKRKNLFKEIIAFLNKKYGEGVFELELKDQYYNMLEIVEKHPEVTNLALEAIRKTGIEPTVKPIRGGTDGSRLSYMNLPCPNIFAGGHNFHGKREFVALETMVKASEVIINIAMLAEQKA